MAEDSEPPIQMEEEQKAPEGAPEWVVTFGDMMSLLLTFFILLLSFAETQTKKIQVFSGAAMEAFGVQTATPAANMPEGRFVGRTEFSMKFDRMNAMNGMKMAKERYSLRSPSGRVDIEVFEDYRGLVVAIGEDAMFESARADLRPAIWPFLDEVLEVALQNRAQIQVEAHTDSNPQTSTVYPTNDHLAAGRAISVVRYFKGVAPDLDAARLETVPQGANRPRAPNMTAAGRRKNRRIELVFYEGAPVQP